MGMALIWSGEKETMSETKRKALLLNSEGCGDDSLGFEILVNLLENLSQRDDRPVAIICWNTAVRLLAEDSPILARLRHLEEKGVNILAGKLCVRELGLTDKIAVGRAATMGEILDIILHNDVINL